MALSIEQFSGQLVESGLLSEEELREYLEKIPAANQPSDSEQLAKRLVNDKRISAFQAQVVYSGKGSSLTIGSYFVLDKLGQGGMGMVLKAEHRMMKRLVAIKVLSPAVTKTKELQQRFQREVEAAARLTHPNIVRAFDAGETNGSPFLVLEYVPGSDLSSIVKKKGPLSVSQAIDCIMQAAQGLEFAHSQGVIHRDIKPANLLMDHGGTVKILDMGLARIDAADVATQADLTGTGAVMGTIDYMAPEQALSTKNADARCDLYSLGISLWFLLTGKTPYEGNSLMARVLAHREQPIPDLRNVRSDAPESLDLIFRKLVAKRPADRYQSATDLIADLQSCPTTNTLNPVIISDTSAASHESPTIIQQGELRPGNGGDPNPSLSGTRTLTRVPLPAASLQQSLLPVIVSESRHHPRSWFRDRRLQIGGAVFVLLLAGVYLASKSSRPVTKNEQASRQKTKSVAPPPAIAPFNSDEARSHQEAWARHLGVPVEYTNSIGMTFQLIPPGEYMMGVNSAEIDEMVTVLRADVYVGGDEVARDVVRSGAPQHKTVLTQPFFLGTHEVTQKEFMDVTGRNPSCFASTGRRPDLSMKVQGKDTSSHPVEDITWHEAVEFCDTLSALEGFAPLHRGTEQPVELTEPGYRLPTEAEWEFACRAGTTSKFWTGDETDKLATAAWSGTTSHWMSHPVGELQPNPFGLYDIHGNVSEFVEDSWDAAFYGKFGSEPAVAPYQQRTTGTRVVQRGSNWYFQAPMCNSGARFAIDPRTHLESVGIRAVMTIAAVQSALKGRSPAASEEADYYLDFPVGGGIAVPTLRRDDNGPYTIEMRLKLRRPGGGVVFCIDGRAACQLQPEANPDVISCAERVVSGGQRVVAPFPANAEWHHVAYVLVTGEAILFIDGKVAARAPRSPDAQPVGAPEANAGTSIGTQRFGNNPTYHTILGAIDELRVSKIARYEKDFIPERRFTTDSDTVALYHCDEGRGGELRDSSGNEHHGKIMLVKWAKAAKPLQQSLKNTGKLQSE